MNNKMKKLGLGLMVLAAATSAHAGREGGNGGDGFAMSFKAIGFDISRHLKSEGLSVVDGLRTSDFEIALKTASVDTTAAELFLNGVRKDAINYPLQHKIVVNIPRWERLSNEAQRQLVIHEVMGLLGINDQAYEKSYYVQVVANLNSANAYRQPKSHALEITGSQALSGYEVLKKLYDEGSQGAQVTDIEDAKADPKKQNCAAVVQSDENTAVPFGIIRDIVKTSAQGPLFPGTERSYVRFGGMDPEDMPPGTISSTESDLIITVSENTYVVDSPLVLSLRRNGKFLAFKLVSRQSSSDRVDYGYCYSE